MLAGEIRDYLKDIPDDAEVMMFFKCRYAISKEEAEKGFYGYINGIRYDKDYNEIKLMN